MYSIYMGGYRAALTDMQMEPKPNRWSEQLARTKAASSRPSQHAESWKKASASESNLLSRARLLHMFHVKHLFHNPYAFSAGTQW